jgi:hypothetical protein
MVVLESELHLALGLGHMLQWSNRDNEAFYPRLHDLDAIRRFECKRRVSVNRECEW